VRKTLLLLVFVPLLTGCDPNVDIPETKCLVFTTMNHHSVTTWVNDEPLLAAKRPNRPVADRKHPALDVGARFTGPICPMRPIRLRCAPWNVRDS